MDLKRNWKEHSFVHLGWIIAFLVFIIIGLLSAKLGTNDNVKDIINFAVSVTSLFLAAFAIVQALLASNALPDAISEVRRAIADVEIPADRLSIAAEIIGNHAGRMTQQAENIGDLANRFVERQQNSNSATDEVKKIGFDTSKETMERAPPIFLLGLHLMLKSYETKKPYIKEGIVKDKQDLMNIVGCITGLLSLRVIDTENITKHEYYVSNLGPLDWIVDDHDWILQTGLASAYNKDWFNLRYKEIDDWYAQKSGETKSA